MASKYLLEDGSGYYLLEDGSGAYLLELQEIAVGQVTETNLARTIAVVVSAMVIAFGTPSETDAAQVIIPRQAAIISLGQIVETDAAQALTPSQAKVNAVGQVIEIDSARPITMQPGGVTVAVGQITETDIARAIIPTHGLIITVNQATETNTARSIAMRPGGATIAVGQITETDIAQTIIYAHAAFIAVNQVLETDVAQVITPSSVYTLEERVAILETQMASLDTKEDIALAVWAFLLGNGSAGSLMNSVAILPASIIAADDAAIVEGAWTRLMQRRKELAKLVGPASLPVASITNPSGDGNYVFRSPVTNEVEISGNISGGTRTVDP